MRPDPSRTLYPPVVRYGWFTGHERLMEIVKIHFPEEVVYTQGPDLFGLDEEPEEIDDEEFEKESPDTELTLLGPGLLLAICDRFGIGDPKIVCISLLNNGMENEDLGLTIGSNYQGAMVFPAQQEEIQAMFAPNEEPAWYLDYEQWHWRRLSKSKQKPRRESKVQIADATRPEAVDASAHPR